MKLNKFKVQSLQKLPPALNAGRARSWRDTSIDRKRAHEIRRQYSPPFVIIDEIQRVSRTLPIISKRKAALIGGNDGGDDQGG